MQNFQKFKRLEGHNVLKHFYQLPSINNFDCTI